LNFAIIALAANKLHNLINEIRIRAAIGGRETQHNSIMPLSQAIENNRKSSKKRGSLIRHLIDHFNLPPT
jgi:hypothetical protein